MNGRLIGLAALVLAIVAAGAGWFLLKPADRRGAGASTPGTTAPASDLRRPTGRGDGESPGRPAGESLHAGSAVSPPRPADRPQRLQGGALRRRALEARRHAPGDRRALGPRRVTGASRSSTGNWPIPAIDAQRAVLVAVSQGHPAELRGGGRAGVPGAGGAALARRERPALAQSALGTMIYLQGVTALRRGENENCLMCQGDSACLLPIAASAVHTKPAGLPAGDPPFHRVPRPVPRQPRGPLALEPGPHDPGASTPTRSIPGSGWTCPASSTRSSTSAGSATSATRSAWATGSISRAAPSWTTSTATAGSTS